MQGLGCTPQLIGLNAPRCNVLHFQIAMYSISRLQSNVEMQYILLFRCNESRDAMHCIAPRCNLLHFYIAMYYISRLPLGALRMQRRISLHTLQDATQNLMAHIASEQQNLIASEQQNLIASEQQNLIATAMHLQCTISLQEASTCNLESHTATHCNTLQHTATH